LLSLLFGGHRKAEEGLLTQLEAIDLSQPALWAA